MSMRARHVVAALPFSLLLACGGSSTPSPVDDPRDGGHRADASASAQRDSGTVQSDPGTKLTNVPTNPADEAAYSALAAQVASVEQLDAAGALATYPTAFQPLGYDASKAAQLDLIQNSAFALNANEQSALAKNGFVISRGHEYPTFLRGLAELYSEHLPLYVSADSLLESVHSSYDSILLDVERAMIIPELKKLLSGMLGRIPSSSGDATAKADMTVYLTVALALLD